jgi:hypothetical protein
MQFRETGNREVPKSWAHGHSPKLHVDRELNIAKYAFCLLIMDHMGCFHILGNKTKKKGNINKCMSKILLSTN